MWYLSLALWKDIHNIIYNEKGFEDFITRKNIIFRIMGAITYYSLNEIIRLVFGS